MDYVILGDPDLLLLPNFSLLKLIPALLPPPNSIFPFHLAIPLL